MSSARVNAEFINKPLLEKALGTKIRGFKTKTIRANLQARFVYRIEFEAANGAAPFPTLIAKCGQLVNNDSASARDRELTFYAQIFPKLELPQPIIYHSELDQNTGERWLLMEDMAPRFRFPTQSHKLTWEELECALRTYARLHAAGEPVLPPGQDRKWLFSYMEPEWYPEQLLRYADTLVRLGHWEKIDRLDRLITAVLAALPDLQHGPLTILHHDVWPSNMGFPQDLESNAALIDWEMAGWGMAEIDLAYLFMSPYRNAEHLDRQKALGYYWSEREQLEASASTPDHLMQRQWLADALLAMNLLQVAFQVIEQPFPPKTTPRRFWDAMHKVLDEKIRALCARI